MDTMCGDCGRHTEVVHDHSTGDTLCSECGLVLESCSIDERSEWRTFADDTRNSDPNRVGIALNPLFGDNLLTTEIINSNGTKPSNVISGHALRGAHNKSHNHLRLAFDELGAMGDRLGLHKTIQGRGCELYKKVFYDENHRNCRGRNLDAALGACLLVSCQQESNPRTVKEICSAIRDGNTTTKKDILKAKASIMKQLVNSDIVDGIGRTIRAGDLIKRFCSNLGIEDNTVMKAALEMTTNCEEEVDIKRSPISIAAAVIYVAVQLNKDVDVGLRNIVLVTNVAEGTIRNTYKDLYPHVRKIFPSWYANEDLIKGLLTSP